MARLKGKVALVIGAGQDSHASIGTGRMDTPMSVGQRVRLQGISPESQR
jgi:hypothetical protein